MSLESELLEAYFNEMSMKHKEKRGRRRSQVFNSHFHYFYSVLVEFSRNNKGKAGLCYRFCLTSFEFFLNIRAQVFSFINGFQERRTKKRNSIMENAK